MDPSSNFQLSFDFPNWAIFLSNFEPDMNRLLFLHEQDNSSYSLSLRVIRPGLKGGKSLPLKLLETEIYSRLNKFKHNSPITFYQTIGITLFNSLFITRVLSVNPFMFHPALSSYRAVTSLAVIGTSIINLLKTVLSMYQYQATFEAALTPTRYEDELSEHEQDSDGSEYELQELEKEKQDTKPEVSNRKFLYSIGLVITGTIVTEYTIFRIIPHHQLYTLYPVYEQTMRWLYAYTTEEKSIRFNEYVSVSPLVLPLVLVFVDGRVKELVQGFMISLVVASALGLKKNKRSIAQFIIFKAKKWYKFIQE
jgi:hypothetical protein